MASTPAQGVGPELCDVDRAGEHRCHADDGDVRTALSARPLRLDPVGLANLSTGVVSFTDSCLPSCRTVKVVYLTEGLGLGYLFRSSQFRKTRRIPNVMSFADIQPQ